MPSSSPVPFLIARSMFSLGIDCWRAVVTAVRRRGLALMSPPPRRAATVISLISLVKALPRLASVAAFLCLIELHFEWPDIARILAGPPEGEFPARRDYRTEAGDGKCPRAATDNQFEETFP